MSFLIGRQYNTQIVLTVLTPYIIYCFDIINRSATYKSKYQYYKTVNYYLYSHGQLQHL